MVDIKTDAVMPDATAKTRKLTSYETDKRLYAARFIQGGRTVYNLALAPAEVAAMIREPDPRAHNPGNRKIDEKHAVAFAHYVIEQPDWVSPAIILRAPTIFSFEQDAEVPNMQFGYVTYAERDQGQIQILDGQHRILGFHVALRMVNDLLIKARNAKATAQRVDPAGAAEAEAQKEIERLERVVDRLHEQRVTVEIQVTDDLKKYRQMFFDIADNAKGISASVKVRFDTTKVVNRALVDVLEHPLLEERVEIEKDRISAASPYWLTAKHVTELIRSSALGFNARVGRRKEKELVDAQVAQSALLFFDALTEAFPQLEAMMNGQATPASVRASSMLGSPTFLRILAGVYYELGDRAWRREDIIAFLGKLYPHMLAPAHANSIWKKYAHERAFDLDAWGPNGRRQDAEQLMKDIVDWAVLRESFVDAEPESAPPAPEPDPDEGIDFAPDLDLKPLEVELRNETEAIAKAGAKRARAVKKK